MNTPDSFIATEVIKCVEILGFNSSSSTALNDIGLSFGILVTYPTYYWFQMMQMQGAVLSGQLFQCPNDVCYTELDIQMDQYWDSYGYTVYTVFK